MSRNYHSLDSVPQEVLEHIAFHVAASDFLGPPSTLIPFISLNRNIYAHLSITSNCHLYAKIFVAKFDTAAAIRRLGPEKITPVVLARELQRRSCYLKRLRSQVGATLGETSDGNALQELLFHVYLMMLENDGKNERQLREYGKIEPWLRVYWFDERGSSRASSNILTEKWSPNDTTSAISMWLLWFFMTPNHDDAAFVTHVLRIFALSAHQYHLTLQPWSNYHPSCSLPRPPTTIHYSEELQLEPPPLATPAILLFLTMVAAENVYPTSLGPSSYLPSTSNSLEWECEWGRCISMQEREITGLACSLFRPGSIEGIWEGFFTFTEFTAYAALLAGASPNVLDKSVVVRHRQTWRLREYHLLEDDSSSSDSGIELDDSSEALRPLSPGDPLRSYVPTGCQIREHRDGAHVQEPGSERILQYSRASFNTGKNCNVAPGVKDTILMGEGHSAWGQFNLIGRVRPCDGFISLTKEYVDGDRGRWLYRGYLVGDVNGIVAGRWRDTFSPVDVAGYEGCFVMSRRR